MKDFGLWLRQQDYYLKNMEKRGSTEKIKYDFDTAKNCQVELNGHFYRTTGREFRSWNGKRRIVSYLKNEEQI